MSEPPSDLCTRAILSKSTEEPRTANSHGLSSATSTPSKVLPSSVLKLSPIDGLPPYFCLLFLWLFIGSFFKWNFFPGVHPWPFSHSKSRLQLPSIYLRSPTPKFSPRLFQASYSHHNSFKSTLKKKKNPLYSLLPTCFSIFLVHKISVRKLSTLAENPGSIGLNNKENYSIQRSYYFTNETSEDRSVPWLVNTGAKWHPTRPNFFWFYFLLFSAHCLILSWPLTRWLLQFQVSYQDRAVHWKKIGTISFPVCFPISKEHLFQKPSRRLLSSRWPKLCHINFLKSSIIK